MILFIVKWNEKWDFPHGHFILTVYQLNLEKMCFNVMYRYLDMKQTISENEILVIFNKVLDKSDII